MSNKLIVSETDLSLVENNSLNAGQLGFLLKKTPDKYVKQRPAKGGGTWNYVSGGYVKKCLNLIFGWQWSFEIMEQMILHGEAIVKGKLTCVSNGVTITKMQFGNKDIVYKKQTDQQKANGEERIPLSIGNDLKAAATDCLKKCAAEIGIAADIYNAEEFREIEVTDDKDMITNIIELFELKREEMTPDAVADAIRIIENKEVKSYTKLYNALKVA